MTKFAAFAMPVLPGKTEQLRQYFDQLTGPRKQEGIDFGKKWNLTREVDFLQHTPNGDFLIISWEGEDLEKFMKDSMKNPDEYTKWNMQQMQEITGAEPPTEESEEVFEFPELILETEVPASESAKIIAFVAPVQPGKTEKLKQFADELKGPRRQEFIDSRKNLGFGERTYLQKSPAGDAVIVTLIGEDPEKSFKEFVQSNDEFAKWFVQHVIEIHGLDIAAVSQQPLPEKLMDTKQLEKEAAAVA